MCCILSGESDRSVLLQNPPKGRHKEERRNETPGGSNAKVSSTDHVVERDTSRPYGLKLYDRKHVMFPVQTVNICTHQDSQPANTLLSFILIIVFHLN